MLVRVDDVAALAALAGVLRAHPVPVLVVGRGSNLLVADAGSRVAIVLGDGFARGRARRGGAVGAGGEVALPVLAPVRGARDGGLEFYVGIPGSVGGAVRMNAGGHGRQTAEVLVSGRGRSRRRWRGR